MTALPRYECLDRLVVGRVAALPIENAVRLLEAGDPLEAARAFFTESAYARAAVSVASPTLAGAIEEWIRTPVPRNAKTPVRALSYALRMASRCTPFGLFSGVGAVAAGDETSVELDTAGFRTHTRPDMEAVDELIRTVESGEERRRVRYVTNDCAFVRGDRLYVTNVNMANLRPNGRLGSVEQRDVSLRHTAAVAFVREYCASGVRYAGAIAALAARFGASDAESERLFDRLVEAGIVISELRASPLGDPFDYLLEKLDGIADGASLGLRFALGEAARLDDIPALDQTAGAHDRVKRALCEATGSALPNSTQVDLRAAFGGTLGRAILADAELLASLMARSGRVFRMQRYRERFLERYEGSDRMVPLLELVDNAVGLGIPDDSAYDAGDDAERDAALLHLLSDAARSNAEEIELEGALLDLVVPPRNLGTPRRSLEIGFQLAAGSYEALQRGEYRMFATLLADRSGKTTSRFAAMLGDDAAAALRDVADRTLPEGEIAAEFSYAPVASRAYSVCIRPQLYDCEVRAGIGSSPAADSLSPSDLWVGIEDERFFVWSQSRARRVSIRETHALMTALGAPNLCRFLALVQSDGDRAVEIDLGAAERLTYRPRLRCGRVVLLPRRWQFPRAVLGRGAAAVARGLAELRERWNLPRYLHLCSGDNHLLVDLDSAVAGALIDEQAGDGVVVFQEAAPAPGQTWLRGDSGNHAVEFVVQAIAAAPAAPAVRDAEPVLVRERARYAPGSRWTYAKLYVGAEGIDDFVAASLAPLVAELRAGDAIDRWFFLRYADPQSHVRVRLRAAATDGGPELHARVASAAQTWLRDGKVHKIAFDTYDPEYERYGGVEGVAAAERFFDYDSDACAAAIGEGIRNTDARIESAAATFDALLHPNRELGSLAMAAFEAIGRNKLEPRDRESHKRIAASPNPAGDAGLLHDALTGDARPKRLRSLLHMHCNRLGLSGEAEDRVISLVRALAVSRDARRKHVEASVR